MATVTSIGIRIGILACLAMPFLSRPILAAEQAEPGTKITVEVSESFLDYLNELRAAAKPDAGHPAAPADSSSVRPLKS